MIDADEIQRADPTARRRAAIWLTVTLLLYGVIVLYVERNRARLETLLTEHGDFLLRHPEIVAFLFLLLALPLMIGAIYLWRLGAAAIRSNRFPPDGVPVIVATPVIRGTAAVARGRLIQILAALIVFCSLSVPVYFWYILSLLANGEATPDIQR